MAQSIRFDREYMIEGKKNRKIGAKQEGEAMIKQMRQEQRRIKKFNGTFAKGMTSDDEISRARITT